MALSGIEWFGVLVAIISRINELTYSTDNETMSEAAFNFTHRFFQ